MRHTFYYLRGALGCSALLEEHQSTVNRLLTGDYTASNLEKLKGHDVYSFRTSIESRLLFSLDSFQDRSYLLVLDYLPNHEYHKSRFLKSGVLSNYKEQLEQLGAEVEDFLFEPATSEQVQSMHSRLSHSPSTEPAKPIVMDYFRNKLIQLSPDQEEAIHRDLPVVMRGRAGSGKTATAVSIFSSYIDAHQVAEGEERQKILYVTSSFRLAEEVKKAWSLLPQSVECRQEVEFHSIQDLIRREPGLANASLVGEQEFTQWYHQYLDKQRRIAKATSSSSEVKLEAAKAYQEFRICSGYTPEVYQQLGVRQSLLDNNQRVWLHKAYTDYINYLSSSELIDPSFYCFSELYKGHYGLVLVDEGQDASLGQLLSLAQLAAHRQFVVCMDDNQRLYDELSVFSRACELLNVDETHRVVLKSSYRCPPQIMAVANQVCDFRDYLAQGTLGKYKNESVDECSEKMGRVYVLDDEMLASNAWIKEMAKGTSLAIVTSVELIEQAKEQFSTPLIFTPEQIKGLEYPVILAWHIYDEKIFKEIKLRSKQLGDAKQPKHQAKKGEGFSQFNPFLNRIYTSYTRATEALVICEGAHGGKTLLLDKIRPFTEKDLPQHASAGSVRSSRDAWLLEVQKHLDLGNQILAKEIFMAQKMGDFAAFIASRPTESIENPVSLKITINPASTVDTRFDNTKVTTPFMIETEHLPTITKTKRASPNSPPATPEPLMTSPPVSPSHAQTQAQLLYKDFNASRLRIAAKLCGLELLLDVLVGNEPEQISLGEFIYQDVVRIKLLHRCIADDLGLLIQAPYSGLKKKANQSKKVLEELDLLCECRRQILLLPKSPRVIAEHKANIMQYTHTDIQLAQLGYLRADLKKLPANPVYLAVCYGNKFVISSLHRLGANFGLPGGMNSASIPIHSIPIHNGDSDTLSFLIGLGIEVNNLHVNNVPAACYAVCAGYLDVLRVLLRTGIDIDTVNADGATLLFCAIQFGQPEVVKYLISKGCSLDSAFTSTEENLIHVADRFSPVVQDNMRRYVDNYLTLEGSDPSLIPVPYLDLAYILEEEECRSAVQKALEARARHLSREEKLKLQQDIIRCHSFFSASMPSVKTTQLAAERFCLDCI